jgi:hypothetical protein
MVSFAAFTGLSNQHSQSHGPIDLQQGIKEKMYIKFIREIKTQALVRTKILLVIEGNNRHGTFCASGLLSSAFLSLR